MLELEVRFRVRILGVRVLGVRVVGVRVLGLGF